MADPTNYNADAKTLFDRACCWLLFNCPSTATLTLNNPGIPKFCPGDSVTFTYSTTGGPFSSNPATPYVVTLDKPNAGDLGSYTNGGYYYYGSQGFAGANLKYEFTVQYEGTYNLKLAHVASGSNSTKLTCIINDENTKTTLLVNQQGASPVDLGSTYYLLKGKRYTVILCNTYISADDLIITGVNLINVGNRFIVQMSNANGDFSSPTDIGFVATGGITPIKTQIPPAATIGTGYKFRLKSTKPSSISPAISIWASLKT